MSSDWTEITVFGKSDRGEITVDVKLFILIFNLQLVTSECPLAIIVVELYNDILGYRSSG